MWVVSGGFGHFGLSCRRLFALGSHEFDDVTLDVESLKAQGGVRQAVFFVIEHFLFLSQVVKKGSVEKGCSWSLRFFRDVISTVCSGLGSQWSTRIEDLGQDLVDIVAKVVGASGSDWLVRVVADLL